MHSEHEQSVDEWTRIAQALDTLRHIEHYESELIELLNSADETTREWVFLQELEQIVFSTAY